MKFLFLFTSTFPCDETLEHYIEHELPVLAKEFEQVFIFPGEFGPPKFILPENVQVINIYDKEYFNFSPLRLVASLPYLFKVLTQEFYHTKIGRTYWLKNIAKATKLLYNALECSNSITKFMRLRNITEKDVCFYSYWLIHSALFLSILKNKKLISTYISRGHSADVYDDLFPDFSLFKIFKLRNLDKLYLVSKHGLDYLVNKYPEFKNKLAVSYLGVTDHGLNPAIKDGSIFSIASCGKNSVHKRIDLIARLLSGLNFPVKWQHFGSITEHDAEKYKQIVEATNPGCEMVFTGHVPNSNLFEYYKNNHVDLFVNTSSLEGLSVAIMDAASFGITLLATDINGTSEIVTPESGYLVPIEFNIEDVTALIKQINEKPDEFQKREGSRNLYMRQFNSEKNYINLTREIKSLN